MNETTVLFWGIDALLAGFILWRLYYLYRDSRSCPNGMQPADTVKQQPPQPVTQPTHPKTFGEAVTEVKDAIVEEGEKLAQGSTDPTPMFDTVTGTSLSLSLVNRLFPGAAAAAAANDRDKKPKVPQTPEERRQMQEAIDKIPPEALKYFDDLIPDDMKPTAPTVMAVPDNEIIKRGIIR